MLKRQLERYGKWLIAIGVLMAIAFACASYILVNQRLTNPFADEYSVKVEMTQVPGLTPGLGQAVNVAGVRVGTIKSVELRDGRAIVDLAITRDKLPKVWSNAFATMIPNSPLKDLLMELRPGGPPAPELKEGGLIPVARTSPPIDSDELTNALDADTRQFFQSLVSGVDTGLKGRGKDLREIFKQLGPTTEDLAAVTGALAERRKELRRLVGNLAVLTHEVGKKDVELARVVDAGNQTVQALASEEQALRASVHKLPGTLRTADRALDTAAAFADELGPAASALRPAARKAGPALRAAAPVVAEAPGILRDKIRPLGRALQPIARDLAPTTRDLNAVTPSLTTAFQVLNYVVNELGHNPEGKEEGYLFWLAWFAHNAMSVVSTEDAHGAALRGLGVFSCEQLSQAPTLAPLLQAVAGALPTC
jgi:phospholipid/cholesterol/gamma-HCH transport system substrate-binding protein